MGYGENSIDTSEETAQEGQENETKRGAWVVSDTGWAVFLTQVLSVGGPFHFVFTVVQWAFAFRIAATARLHSTMFFFITKKDGTKSVRVVIPHNFMKRTSTRKKSTRAKSTKAKSKAKMKTKGKGQPAKRKKTEEVAESILCYSLSRGD